VGVTRGKHWFSVAVTRSQYGLEQTLPTVNMDATHDFGAE
jgi:hypothetical protein